MPASFSVDVAILLRGEPKSGRSIIARIRPMTQKRWMCVKSASKPSTRDDLELQLLRLVRHAFRQRMQAQKEISDGQDRGDQEHRYGHHENVRVPGAGDEARKVMRRRPMSRWVQILLP